MLSKFKDDFPINTSNKTQNSEHNFHIAQTEKKANIWALNVN